MSDVVKKGSLTEAEVIPRKYGTMRMLAGGRNLKTQQGDLRVLEIEPGRQTSTHYHKKSESIFHIQVGELEMAVDGTAVNLSAGDTIVVEPGEIHVLKNVGTQRAIVIEAMAPGYSGQDIFFVEETPSDGRQ